MKKILSSIFLSLFIIATFANVAGAVTFENGNNLVIKDSTLDDVYLMGGNAIVEGTIYGDLYVMAGSVFVSGDIEEDVVVLGGDVTITGNVGGDVRVMGGNVGVFGNISDDLIVSGGKIDVGNSSVINGTVMAGAGILTLDGKVGEDLRGAVSSLFLNGEIRGNVLITVGENLHVSKDAYVGGDFTYSSILESDIPPKVVHGEVLFNKFEKNAVLNDFNSLLVLSDLISFLGTLLLALLFITFVPRVIERAGNIAKDQPFKVFGIGTLSVITFIIGFPILLITIIAIPVALAFLFAFVIMLYLAKIYFASFVLSYFYKFKKKPNRLKLFAWMSLVLFAMFILINLPWVGIIFSIVIFLIGTGTAFLVVVDNIKLLKSKKHL